VHVEVRAIAVSATVTFPAQPTIGLLTFVPLGGDGYTAPFGAYSLLGHRVTGASGGGSMVLRANMDPRYTSLISYVTGIDSQVASADADVRLLVTADDSRVPPAIDQGLVAGTDAVMSTNTIVRTWNPPALILPGGNAISNVRFEMVNVENDVYVMHALVYLFNIRVRELTPMGPLLWSRGSGAT